MLLQIVAAIFGISCFALRWPEDIILPHISLLEPIPIILAASVRGKFWSGQRVLFQCDNRAAVDVLQKYTSKNLRLLKLKTFGIFSCPVRLELFSSPRGKET